MYEDFMMINQMRIKVMMTIIKFTMKVNVS